MATEVYFPVASPTDPSHMSEHHPYGPAAGGVFNTDLGIEIQSAQVNNYPLLAVVDGTLRVIPFPASPLLVLNPNRAKGIKDLTSVVGDSPVVFLYRNVDLSTVVDAPALTTAMERWQRSEHNKANVTLAQIRDQFVEGGFFLPVKAGDILGNIPDATSGNPNFGFEVVYIPNGLVNEAGWLRLTEILDPANPRTRRLDPTSFYFLVSTGPTSDIHVKLPPSQSPHSLMPLLTKRILVEVRDEYDIPLQGTVRSTGGTTVIDHVLTIAQRGTFQLPHEEVWAITREGRYFTQLPTAPLGHELPVKLLKEPAHWALQSIYMDGTAPTAEHWFAPNESTLPLFTSNNQVTPLIDGIATFKEMVQALRQVRGSTNRHFVFMGAWWLSNDVQMIPSDPDTTFAKLTTEIAASGANVYAIVWKVMKLTSQFKTNSNAVDGINDLKQGTVRKGFAILDPEKVDPPSPFEPPSISVGSHHQKFMIASAGSNMAVAFCGGVDINANRLDTPKHKIDDPYHDIHAKVEGPAVADLCDTFVQRWNFNPEVAPTGLLPRIDPSVIPHPPGLGSQFVQVTRTYPRKSKYPFAPLGELGTLSTLLRAINRAQRYIYFEDQYVTPYAQGQPDGSDDSLGILTALLAALHRIEYLLVVLPNYAGQPHGRLFRHRFLRVLEAETKKPGTGKLLVFYLRRNSRKSSGTVLKDVEATYELMSEGLDPDIKPPLEHSGDTKHSTEIFSHSKIWLIDDVYAKIGSANVNRRSLTHDTEVDIHVVDGAIARGARKFARDFRLQLWGEMLNKWRDENLQLEDPSYALQFWENPPKGSFIVPYVSAAGGGDKTYSPGEEKRIQRGWDNFIDPDGR